MTLNPGQDWQPAESRWESLRYYSLYRLIAASGLAFMGRVFISADEGGGAWGLILGFYFAAAVALLYFLRMGRLRFVWILNLHVIVDLLALGALMYVGGGHRSGIPYMVMVVVAAGGLLGEGRLVFFYASLASLTVLIVQILSALKLQVDPVADFTAVGLICVGFFAIALVARLLATRALANEQLAHQRGNALLRQTRVNEKVIADLNDGVLVLDSAGLILQINPKAAILLGDKPEAGMPLARLAPELAEAVREGQRILRLVVSGQAVRLRTLKVGPGEDTVVYLEDLERLEREAQQIKLAALGRLTGSIAHEIRNPLAAISHASELMAEEKRADVQARLTRIIQDNTRRIERMVRDVLELGRRDRCTPETIALDGFIAGFIADSETYEGLVPGVVAYHGLPGLAIQFDRIHLQQLLWNLVGNARRFSSGSPGAIRIAAQWLPEGRIQLKIQDDGPGVSLAMRSRVFEPFFTTDSRGTGLGLYIARELACANDALLELCESESGACFCLTAEGANELRHE